VVIERVAVVEGRLWEIGVVVLILGAVVGGGGGGGWATLREMNELGS
jgi:hypothetical protein